MIHIFRHQKGKLKGKLDFAQVSNGKVVSKSPNQGYEKMNGVFTGIRSDMKAYNGNWNRDTSFCYFQDDTMAVPAIFILNATGKPIRTKKKAKPSYIPNSKK